MPIVRHTFVFLMLFFLVPWVGLEPTRDYSHTYLKRTRMPIPPPGQDITSNPYQYLNTSDLHHRSDLLDLQAP